MKRLIALLMAAVLALGLTACGGEKETAEQVTVRYGLSNAWDSLMPYNSPSGSNYTRIVCDKIYDRLAYVHADGTLDPRGAKSWESTDDGMAGGFPPYGTGGLHVGPPAAPPPQACAHRRRRPAG